MDLIMLLYTFLVICLDWYKEQTICKLSELVPGFTCARAIGNLWSICLGIDILSPVPFDLKMASDLNFALSLSKLISFCLE